MKYIYYKSHKGNFGDDLNAWLWPKIFGESIDNDKNVLLGIGSILFNEFEPLSKLSKEDNKIVFGTGIRPSLKIMEFDKTWDIQFLRGPLSSMSQKNNYEYIADAAYALRQVDDFKVIAGVEKKYEVSVMPYFKSLKYVNWEKICENLGYHYISPLSENGVEFTLKEIAASKVLITEAMHGAIVADILRVPWKRFVFTTPFTEGQMVSEFKWMDWLFSINQKYNDSINIYLYRKTFLNKWFLNLTKDIINIEFLISSKVNDDILKMLSNINDYSLSDDNTIDEIDSKIYEKIYSMNKRYGNVI